MSELAARYGARVAEETSDWRQAYATFERFRRGAAAARDKTPLPLFGGRGGSAGPTARTIAMDDGAIAAQARARLTHGRWAPAMREGGMSAKR